MRRMSLNLTSARNALNSAKRGGPARKMEDQFKDLCRAVEYIIKHLQKLEHEMNP
jgi:hypothetical protein